MKPVPVAAFASGSGTNLQALLDYPEADAHFEIRLVLTDRPCGAEGRAEAAGVAVTRVAWTGRPVQDVSREVLKTLDGHAVEVVVLAGFLRLVPAPVVQAFPRRILNVHPALLPAFGGRGMYGLNVHRAVLDAGAKLSGPTVHFVDEAYDEGSILAQWPVPVHVGDTPEALASRVLSVEHVLLPAAVDALAEAIRTGEGSHFNGQRTRPRLPTQPERHSRSSHDGAKGVVERVGQGRRSRVREGAGVSRVGGALDWRDRAGALRGWRAGDRSGRDHRPSRDDGGGG